MDLVEVAAASVIAYGAIRAEYAYRKYRAAKMFGKTKEPRVRDPRVVGITRGANEAIACACGDLSKDVVNYNTGEMKCLSCYNKGEN